MAKIAILQSNYLPWKGVFDIINRVDMFVFLEDVQYTKRDWRNRNKILTKNGTEWITVPVINKDRRNQLIYEAEIDNSINWRRDHYKAIKFNYSKAPYFKKYEWILEDLYINRSWERISDLNIYFTKLISEILEIKTNFVFSPDLGVIGEKGDKLIGICKKLNASCYLSGPAAKSYIDSEKFLNESIKLEYMDYEYPKYQQLFEPFDHNVTILDLLFNCGEQASQYIWNWRESKVRLI